MHKFTKAIELYFGTESLNDIDKWLSRLRNISYDDNENIVEEKVVFEEKNPDKDISQISAKNLNELNKYKYDKNGNWLQKTVIKNKIPDTIVEREIDYY